MLVALGAVVVFPLILSRIGLGWNTALILSLVRWPVFALVFLIALALLYRYEPNRRAAQWQWLSAGSVLATAAWIVASLALSFYLPRFADFGATYGSLGAAIGLMMWMWLSSIVVLAGAELNAEVEQPRDAFGR